MSAAYRILTGVLVLFTLSTIGALVFYLVRISSQSTAKNPLPSYATAHFYGKPEKSIANVVVKTLYVVPKNRKPYAGWREAITASLKKAGQFHHIQFFGTSNFRYEVFPEPVILQGDSAAYDKEAETEKMISGNPYALIAIAEEIEKRVFRADGDLYNKEFALLNSGEYPVMGLLYEGVGAAGSPIYESELETAREIAKYLGVPESSVAVVQVTSVDGFFLLNREYVTNLELSPYGATTLYHEFAHAIGLPDGYDRENGQSFSDDIMGGGRTNPIETTYLGKPFLREMGVAGNTAVR